MTATLEEWRLAYRKTTGSKLQKKGTEYVGPCPCCGGDDRFAITERDGKVVVNCRGCGDYKAIRSSLFGSRNGK